MRVVEDLSMKEILQDSWGGATYAANKILEEGLESAFENLVYEFFGDPVDRTKLNDFLWYDRDLIYESLGIVDEDDSVEGSTILGGGRHKDDSVRIKKSEDEVTEDIKGSIEEAEIHDYIVTISFGGYVGSDNEYEVSGTNEEDATSDALDQAKGDLSVEDFVEVDENEWEVTVGFAGQLGTEETYTVTADNEDEAADAAIEEASWDLTVDSIELND